MTPTLDALKHYLDLRTQLVALAERESGECSCDPNNFHTCEFCQEEAELSHQSRRLVELWGDNWAVLLAQYAGNELNGVTL